MPRSLTVGLAVALLGLGFVAYGFTNPGSMCLHLEPHSEWDRTGVTAYGAARCHLHLPGGRVEHATVLPWGDWATVALVAASAGLFFAALEAPRRKAAKAAGAYLLFFAAAIAWFVGSWAVWGPLLAVAAVAAVMAARGRGVRRSAAPR